MTWRTHLTPDEQKSLSASEAILEDCEHGALVLNANDEIRKLKRIARIRAKRKAAE